MNQRHRLALVVLAISVFAVYAGSLEFPFVNWDDPRYVTENESIRGWSWDHLREWFRRPYVSIYVPLTMVSYALDFQIWELDPFGYHLTNLILHTANAGLIYWLVFLLTGDWWIALAVALVFGIQPVQVESVVWVSGRKNLLAAFFFLAAFLTYVYSSRARRANRPLLAISCTLFLASCLSKPSGVVFPLLVFVYDFSFGHFKKQDLWKYFPFAVIALAFGWLAFRMNPGGGHLPYHGDSFFLSLLAMSVVMMKYLGLLILPINQSVIYQIPVYTSALHPPVAWSLAGNLAAAVLVAWSAVRARKLFVRCSSSIRQNPSPLVGEARWGVAGESSSPPDLPHQGGGNNRSNALFFFSAWYLIHLLPVLNLIPFPSMMNDRYLYLAMAGIFACLFTVVKKYAGAAALWFIVLAGAAGFTWLNMDRQSVWSDSEKLWLDADRKTGGKHAVPALQLAEVYKKQGETEKAKARFEQALAILEEPEAYRKLRLEFGGRSDWLKLVGEYFFRQGKYNQAVDSLEKSVASGGDADAYNFLGLSYYLQGDLEQAGRAFAAGVAGNPRNPRLYSNQALVYAGQGQWEPALGSIRKAIALNPEEAGYYNNLADLLEKTGRPLEAEQAFIKALSLDPKLEGALYNLGLIYSERGNRPEASRFWTRLLRLNPTHEKAAEIQAKLRELPQND